MSPWKGFRFVIHVAPVLLDCQWQMCLNCATVERAPFCYTCCAGIARLCLLDCQWQMCLNCVTVERVPVIPFGSVCRYFLDACVICVQFKGNSDNSQ